MNNLKRVLSLGLVGTMLSGMMIMGASAATKDFTDAKDIEQKDAVSTMVALGVINGKEDGSSFDPKGPVTRAEMAKMLCVAMNGGVDPVLGTKATPSFTDIKGTWAESYIEYCTATKIIAGRNDGTFGPTATVTSTEAAKMILVALGYDATTEGFVGMDWAINTNSKANTAGLYDDLSKISTTEAMTRENAAQMLYNALDSKFVTYSNGIATTSQYSYTTPVKVQIGTDVTYVLNITSTLNAAATALDGKGYDSLSAAKAAIVAQDSAAKYDTNYTVLQQNKPVYSTNNSTVTADETFGHKYLTLTTKEGVLTEVKYDDVKKTFSADIGGVTYSKLDNDPSEYMQENVKVLFKAADDVFGVYQSTTGSVLATGYAGDIEQPDTGASTSVKINGTTYKLSTDASSVAAVPFNEASGHYTLANIDSIAATTTIGGYTFKLVDTDGDSKGDVLSYVPFTVGKVTYLGQSTMTVTKQSTNGVSSIGKDLDDYDVYEGIAKDDLVITVPAANTAKGLITVTKAATAENAISGTKGTSPNTKYLVDGTWMNNATSESFDNGDTITYIALGSTVYYAKVTSGSTGSGSLAMVYRMVTSTGTTSGSSLQVDLILADGSKKTSVTVDKVNTLSVDATTSTITGAGSVNAAGIQADVGADKDFAAGGNGQASQLMGALVSYELNSDNHYELKTIPLNYDGSKKVLGYDGTLNNVTYTGGSSKTTFNGDSNEIADDAVIFVFSGDNTTAGATAKAKVITGRDLKNSNIDVNGNSDATVQTADTTSTITGTAGLYSTSNGFKYLKAGVINATGDDPDKNVSVTSGANYGYLTSDAYKSTEGTTSYTNYTMWTANGEITVKEKATTNVGLAAGSVVTYDANGEGVVKNVTVMSPTLNAVTGYDSSNAKKIQTKYDTAYTKINDDTTILYVNSDKTTGVEGGSISVADKPNGTDYQYNVLTIPGSNNAFALIVVDTANKMQYNGSMPVITSATGGEINNALASSKNVTVTTATDLGGLVIPTGKTVTVTTVSAITGTNVTVSAGATLVIGTLSAATTAITGAGTVQINTAITAGADQIKTDNVNVNFTLAVATLEQIPCVAGKTLTTNASSGNATANKWFTTAGVSGVSNGTALSSVVVTAGTYVGATCYSAAGEKGNLPVTAWLAK